MNSSVVWKFGALKSRKAAHRTTKKKIKRKVSLAQTHFIWSLTFFFVIFTSLGKPKPSRYLEHSKAIKDLDKYKRCVECDEPGHFKCRKELQSNELKLSFTVHEDLEEFFRRSSSQVIESSSEDEA